MKTSYRTLLVDDEGDFYKMIEPMFRDFGIRFVNNIDVAANILSNTSYDLILLDLNFNQNNPKDVSGLELISKDVKAPIIVITNSKDVSIHNSSQLKGAKRCLYKGDYNPKGWKNIFLDVIGEFKEEESQSKYQALIMKGGGVKGLAYVGAIEELNKFYTFNWFVGTSAGAIAACLLGAGYTVKELEGILSEKNFTDFLDASIIGALWNFIKHRGFYEGISFQNWIDDLLIKKLNKQVGRVMFKDLPNRVTIYASKRNSAAVIFDSTDPKYHDTPVAFAVRCSMSIPFIFTPQRQYGMRLFDGGMQNNYPVEQVLRQNPDTPFVGLYLGDEYYKGVSKNLGLLKEFYLLYTEGSDIEALEKHEDHTVIIDPSPIKTINFNLSKKQKDFLVLAGELGALKFLNKKGKVSGIDEKIQDLTKERDRIRELLVK